MNNHCLQSKSPYDFQIDFFFWDGKIKRKKPTLGAVFFGISFLILLVFVEGFPFDFFGAVLDLSSSHSAAAYDFFDVSAAVYSSS